MDNIEKKTIVQFKCARIEVRRKRDEEGVGDEERLKDVGKMRRG